MAPFRLNRGEYEHDLPWRLLQNGPVTLYWRKAHFDEDIGALRVGPQMPAQTGHSFDALADSLSEIEVPRSPAR